VGAVGLFAALSPAFLSDFGVHNDWSIGDRVLVPDLTLGHAESYHLVRVGRLLNALLYNAQWRQIETYTDLRLWRFLAALLTVASFAAVALHAGRFTTLSGSRGALLVFALFLAPPLVINSYYASLFVPGAVAIALVSGVYIIQQRLFVAAWASRSPRSWLPVASVLTALALVVGHFLYTPSTAFFLVLAAFSLLYGGPRGPRTALLELGAYVLSCLLYFVLQREIVFPWASQAFAYDSRWTDPQYTFDVAWMPGERSLEFLRDAASVSFNAWNAFLGFDASWLTISVVCIALLRKARTSNREGRLRGLFVLAFFSACVALSIAPSLLSDFRWTGYRILVGPVLLVCVAFLWALPSLIPSRAGRAERALPAVSCLILTGVTFAALATAVREARTEVGCFEDFVLNGPLAETVLLLGEESGAGRSRLRQEFGSRIREAGPVAEFGFQVIAKLRRDGQLLEPRGSLLRYLSEVGPEALEPLPLTGRIAVLDVNATGCSCVAGPACLEPPAGSP
jgi:hypothetical protein